MAKTARGRNITSFENEGHELRVQTSLYRSGCHRAANSLGQRQLHETMPTLGTSTGRMEGPSTSSTGTAVEQVATDQTDTAS